MVTRGKIDRMLMGPTVTADYEYVVVISEAKSASEYHNIIYMSMFPIIFLSMRILSSYLIQCIKIWNRFEYTYLIKFRIF